MPAVGLIRVQVNGTPREIPEGCTVADLLARLSLAAPLVAVEVNRDVVPRARHADVRLRDGDAVEVVQFVGGG
jgi:sulfur carrier protein